jgi:hypothetical protein
LSFSADSAGSISTMRSRLMGSSWTGDALAAVNLVEQALRVNAQPQLVRRIDRGALGRALPQEL